MTEVGFYHLTTSTLDQALPALLERVLAAGQRAVLRAVSPERLDALDRLLWTYDRAAFLPHGTKADGFAQDQPIWLTTAIERPNEASVLVLVEAAPMPDLDAFDRVLDLFDGNDATSLELARTRWRECREQGLRLVYWTQTKAGWRIAREVAAQIPGLPSAADAISADAGG